VLLCGFWWGAQRWSRKRQDVIGPAIVLGFPVIAAVTLASTFLVHGIRERVWGNGAQAASTAARVEQYHTGIPLVLKNPFGYGIGRAAATLGFAPFGYLTIDTYYLAVALEYGVMGFCVFFGLIACGIGQAFLDALRRIRLRQLGIHTVAIGTSLTVFLIIKSVFAQTDNMPILYMLLGMLAAAASTARAAAGSGVGSVSREERARDATG
jgi:hypothetical protein